MFNLVDFSAQCCNTNQTNYSGTPLGKLRPLPPKSSLLRVPSYGFELELINKLLSYTSACLIASLKSIDSNLLRNYSSNFVISVGIIDTFAKNVQIETIFGSVICFCKKFIKLKLDGSGEFKCLKTNSVRCI